MARILMLCIILLHVVCFSFGIEKTIEGAVEYKRRREIVDKYMKTLSKAQETWVDPYDMLADAAAELKAGADAHMKISDEVDLNPPAPEGNEKSISTEVAGKELSVSVDSDINNDSGHARKHQTQMLNTYISRWLKKIILKVEQEPGEIIAIQFPLDSNVLYHLKELADAETTSIEQVDMLISKQIEQSIVIKHRYFDWSILKTHTRGILLGVCVVICLYVIYQSLIHHPFRTILFLTLATSIFWHWMHLYQQKLAHKHAELSSGRIPTQCIKHELGFIELAQEYFRSFFHVDDCSKHFEALMVDPFWEISLTMAVSETFSSMLFQLLPAAARQINYSVKQLFDGLPIVTSAILLIILFIFLLMMFNYRIKLPFFMGAIEPSFPPRGSCVEDVPHPKPIGVSEASSESSVNTAPVSFKLPNTLQLIQASSDSESSVITAPVKCKLTNSLQEIHKSCDALKISVISDELSCSNADTSSNKTISILSKDSQQYCHSDNDIQSLHSDVRHSDSVLNTNEESSPTIKTLHSSSEDLVVENIDTNVIQASHNVL